MYLILKWCGSQSPWQKRVYVPRIICYIAIGYERSAFEIRRKLCFCAIQILSECVRVSHPLQSQMQTNTVCSSTQKNMGGQNGSKMSQYIIRKVPVMRNAALQPMHPEEWIDVADMACNSQDWALADSIRREYTVVRNQSVHWITAEYWSSKAKRMIAPPLHAEGGLAGGAAEDEQKKRERLSTTYRL